MTIYRVYKNLPFSFKAKKDRYWDLEAKRTISNDATETFYMQPYDGLDYCLNENATAPLLFIRGGKFPDYSSVVPASGCMMPEGTDYLVYSEGYYDVPMFGEVNVDYETGVAEGFSENNYVKLSQCIETEQYEVFQKVYFDGEAREQIIWQADGGNFVGMSANKLVVCLSNRTFGTTVFESGIYWFRASFDHGVFKVFWLADAEETYTLETLPDISEWGEEIVIEDCVSPLACSSFLRISNNSEAYWGGKMYLSGARVVFGGLYVSLPYLKSRRDIYKGLIDASCDNVGAEQDYNIFYKDEKFVADAVEAKAGYGWCGLTSVSAFDQSAVLRANFTRVGELVFSYLRMSGFSAENYLITRTPLPTTMYFQVGIKIVTKVRVVSPQFSQRLLGDNSANNHGVGVCNQAWVLYGSSEVSGGTALNGSTYWVQVVQEAGQGTKLYYLQHKDAYTLETLPDVEEWETGPAIDGVLFDQMGKSVRIGCTYDEPFHFWSGDVDLDNTCIYGKGQASSSNPQQWTKIWEPFS